MSDSRWVAAVAALSAYERGASSWSDAVFVITNQLRGTAELFFMLRDLESARILKSRNEVVS